MKDLIKKVEKLVDDVERLQSLQTATGSGGGVSTATLPLAITGSNIALGINVANDGGAIVKSPASQQTGNINITGNITANGNATVGSVITSTVSTHSLTATSGPITSNGSMSAATSIQAITGPYFLGSVPILDSGGTFPTSGLVDGERYWHNVYRSWFVYNLTDLKWRQEGPGVFASTFPTVSAGDAIAAPQMQVTRLDRNITYYYDGTRWLSVTLYKQPFISRSNQPFAQAQTFFDTAFVDYATGSGIYVTKISGNVFPVTAQSGTNFYTLTAGVFDTSGVQSPITFTGSNDTKTMTTANSWRPLVPTFTPVVFGNTSALAFLVMTPTAAPGTFFMNATLQYQLIG